jgi:quinol-cytochrome oxidoreductase complex cytochrome b subunit
MTTERSPGGGTSKTYGLMALVKGSTPMVGKGPDNTVMSWPRLLMLEALIVLGTMVLLLFMSAVADAPLRELANPDVTENPAKAAWYFISLQELLLHMDTFLAGVLVPGLLILILLAVPYIDRSKRDVGIWFASKNGKRIAKFAAVYTTVWFVALILFDEFIRVKSLFTDPLIASWLIPVGVMLGLMALLYVIVKKMKATMRETMVGFFTAFMVTYFILTLVGTFFRGRGMNLIWPWDLPPGALPF